MRNNTSAASTTEPSMASEPAMRGTAALSPERDSKEDSERRDVQQATHGSSIISRSARSIGGFYILFTSATASPKVRAFNPNQRDHVC